MDSVSPEIRSRVMAQVRSQRNRSTEWRLRSALIRAGIRGWTLNPADVAGKPDFVFRSERVVVFVDGCFWHGCPRCCRMPSSNSAYWERKIKRNTMRDRAVARSLRKDGWRVLRIWEHDLKRIPGVVTRIRNLALADGRNDPPRRKAAAAV